MKEKTKDKFARAISVLALLIAGSSLLVTGLSFYYQNMRFSSAVEVAVASRAMGVDPLMVNTIPLVFLNKGNMDVIVTQVMIVGQVTNKDGTWSPVAISEPVLGSPIVLSPRKSQITQVKMRGVLHPDKPGQSLEGYLRGRISIVSAKSKDVSGEFTIGTVRTIDGEIRQMGLYEAKTRIE